MTGGCAPSDRVCRFRGALHHGDPVAALSLRPMRAVSAALVEGEDLGAAGDLRLSWAPGILAVERWGPMEGGSCPPRVRGREPLSQ